MINRHSILFKLNIIFFLTLLFISAIFFAMNDFMGKKSSMDFEHSLRGLRGTLELYSTNSEKIDFNEFLSAFRFKQIIADKKNIILNANRLSEEFLYKHHIPPFFQENEKLFFPPSPPAILTSNFQLLSYKDELYIHLLDNQDDYLLKYEGDSSENILLLIRIGYLLFISLLVMLYFMIRKNLYGLKVLQKSLIEYENGIVDKTKIIEGRDEVSIVSQEFYKVASKLDALNKTRKLFLRNMMHELKTPLTKSKLYLSLMEETQMRDSLELSLQKLELLIDDMANIEKISTDTVEIDKKEYRLIDIVENAKDMLFINQESVFMDDSLNYSVNVDFKLFTIVMKNLIDNGIKYSKNSLVFITCQQGKISIASGGEKLKYDFKDYLEPFFKGDLNEITQRGFGLGLYIVNEILIKHGFSFSYEHKQGKHIFIIGYPL